MSKTGLLAAVFVAVAACAGGHPPWFVNSWQSDDGLPDNSVVGIGQTPDNFLWVATQTGMIRFDGRQFREFPIQPHGIYSRTVHALCSDRRGRLWVAMERGAIVCIEQGRKSVIIPPDNARPDRRALALVEDGEGAMWISFVAGDLVRVKDGRVRFFTEADGLPAGDIFGLTVDQAGHLWFLQPHQVGVFRDGRFSPLVSTPAACICQARSGGIWICSKTHIVKYSEAGGISEKIELQTGVSDPAPMVLLEDRKGRLWIGTRLAGLFCYDGKRMGSVDTSEQAIFSLKEDHEGNIWVGTRGGVKQVKPRVAELLTTGSSAPFDKIDSICKDTKGQLWAVVGKKRALVRNEGAGWLPLSVREGWTVNYCKSVEADPRGGVWIGTTYDGLFRWQDGAVTHHYCSTNSLVDNWVSALRMTASGALWMGVGAPSLGKHSLLCWKDGNFRKFALPTGSGLVTALEADASGDCWAATGRGLLVRVHGDALVDETKKLLTEPYPIRALLATPDNSLWIGFAGMGLGRLKEGRFTHCRMEQGLHDDYISHILSDGRGRLWLAGNRGIFSVREKELDALAEGRSTQVQSVAYKQKDGLSGLQASYDAWPGALRDADGRLLFAMQSGVAILYAEEIVEALGPPSVAIDRVLANGKTVALYGAGDALSDPNTSAPLELGQAGVHLRLPPGLRQVEFSFTAPSFTMPESIGFKYRLQGLDKDWMDAGLRRSILYSQLMPGHYRFQVLACNRAGVWNEKEESMELTVAPFWWETAWFRVAGPILGFGLFGGFVVLWLRRRYQFQIERLELLRAMEKERARIAADLHDEIGANLTHISILSSLAAKPSTETDTARQHNAEVISVARQTILAFDEILWSVNPKNDTLRSLSHFICRRTEEILSPAKVTYHFTLDEAIPDRPLSPQLRYGLLLAAKEALHNILKHSGASRVEVQCAMEGNVFVVNLSDNGCGFAPSNIPVGVTGRKGHGLENMCRRLKELGGECRIEQRAEGGTRISFRLPME